MNRILRNIQREEGFWSSMVLIFLVTLSLMGMGAFVLIRGEGINMGHQIKYFQSEFSATGAAYFGIERMKVGGLDSPETITIGDATIQLSKTTVDASTVRLTVNSTVDDIETEVQVDMLIVTLQNVAVWTTGTVNDVTVKDEAGNENPDLMISEADSLPQMDTASMIALSTSQGHNKTGTFTPSTGYPSTSFFASGTTPNVTYVDGDLVIEDGRVVYGIFIVTGNVYVNSSWSSIGRVEGVVYLPNQTSSVTMSMEGQTSINGGVLTGGNIDGTGWLDGTIKYNSERMNSFAQFRSDPSAGGTVRPTKWTIN